MNPHKAVASRITGEKVSPPLRNLSPKEQDFIMADSPETSPPAPDTPNAESNGTTSPPIPPASSPPSPDSAPPPTPPDSSPPPAPPTQETSPPPSLPSSPPAVPNPPPQTPQNPSPPSPEGSSPVTPPAPPQTPSIQSPPLPRPSPPSPAANDDRNRTKGNNRDGSTPSPPSGNRGSSDGGSPSPPRPISPPRNSGDSDTALPPGEHQHQPNIGLIIGVIVGAGLLLLLLMFICLCCYKRSKKKRAPQVNHMHYYNNNTPFGAPNGNGGYYNNGTPQEHVVNMDNQGGGNWGGQQQPVSGPLSDSSYLTVPSPPAATLGHNQSTFTYDELSLATEGFSESNLLGQGGFGYVHKGVLPSGKEVAVKSLKVGSGQGEREFQAEVEIISRVHHRHLVSLVGYCISGGQRLLVYEFLPNNTLEFHLHGKGRPVLDWHIRVKIALGSARGLAYLHEDCHPRIIHRDIKAANILLDFSFETQVADFGLAKLSQDNYTHVSTRVMGTFGYLAPEYASSGKLSDKSDVFSFGVMLLELITGRPPVDLTGEMEDSLVDWARPLCSKAAQDGDYSQLADPRLETNYDQQEMVRMASCAAAAIRHSARRRPKMSQIVRALEGDMSIEDLSEGGRAAQNTYLSPGSGSSEYDTRSYSADMKKFRKLALESKEYQTNEYGLNPSTSTSEEMDRGSVKPSPQI
ncbi:unnamed protein product [Eruca vesicaria subsp. sativa]|uniref:non-specific serine/threonine protein kinase n=1 Tax=Eruca vesicaria subsp. sativa TaxID=29727 RepID=A0ABC8JAM2_ERUVS|nr:unnamed protein product [Eruca vesicaria subsp. sativa]